ncbi:MAG TPA: hypothetical protein VHZ95_03475, partial [Polyangiales bacterium]|nr:hypothetical protein [Polyangiales bacterium]
MSEVDDQPAAISGMNAERSWLSQRERGAIAGMRALFWIATAFGRAPARLLVRVIALYYALFDRSARAASRTWLARVHGRPIRFREIYRHVLCFAQVTLDRVFLLLRHDDAFVVHRTGHEYLAALTRERTGAVLLGAHLGSFEAMRIGAEIDHLPINIVGHFENARMINALLAELDPNVSA